MRYLTLITILFFLSCNKEDDILPNIEWLQPTSGQSYQFGDNIIVKGKVNDNRSVEWVEISVLNQYLTPVYNRRIYYNASSVDFYANISLDDVHNESGNYYLKVRASDGVNLTSEHRPFNYIGAPKVFNDLLVCSVNSGKSEIRRLNDLSIVSSYTYSVSDFSVNSWEQDLLTYGYSGPIESFDLNELQFTWSKTSVNWLDTLQLSNINKNSSSVATHLDGWFVINSAGVSFGGNFYGSTIKLGNSLITSNYVFLEYIVIPSGQHALMKCSYVSGVTLDLDNVVGDIVLLSEMSNRDLLILTQHASDIEIYIYNSLTGSLNNIRTISGEIVQSSIQINDNLVYISTNNGLFSYTIGNNSWVNLNSNVYNDLAYNEVDQVLYGLQFNGTVQSLDNLGNVLSSTTVSNAVGIDVWYNK